MARPQRVAARVCGVVVYGQSVRCQGTESPSQGTRSPLVRMSGAVKGTRHAVEGMSDAVERTESPLMRTESPLNDEAGDTRDRNSAVSGRITESAAESESSRLSASGGRSEHPRGLVQREG